MHNIKPISPKNDELIQKKIDLKTKPPGALGQLEKLALQIARVQDKEPLTLNNPLCLVFAADHGIARQGVSIAPSEVTAQMVTNFVQGGAAINCFCRTNQIQLKVIDAGVLSDTSSDAVINKRIDCGTRDFSQQPAMTFQQAERSLKLGSTVIDEVAQASDLIAFGEMGIGNTSSASALMAALTGLPVSDCVGAGTGVSAEIQAKKVSLIESALKRLPCESTPTTILSEVGGFEIGEICGAMLRAAELGKLILVDGFICSAAALLAKQLNPHVVDYMILAHCSEEKGHQALLAALTEGHQNLRPLLNLGLRLGEGTGAALAVPLVRAAISFYNDMASFEQAEVIDVVSGN